MMRAMPPRPSDNPDAGLHWLLLISGLGLLIWSGIEPRDRLTWAVGVAPAVVGGALLLATYQRLRLSTLAYVLVWVYAILLIAGAHWTYGQMPLFGWLQRVLALERNYYDRVAYLAQGFVSAILVREVLVRRTLLRRGRGLFVIVVALCTAIGAIREILEWGAVAVLGASVEPFLPARNDVWQTQANLLAVTLGAAVSLAALSRTHDRSLYVSFGKGMGIAGGE
jgi:putative membrane protein